MSLAETIQEDLKAALKAKDSAKLSTLRMLKSEIRNQEIEVGGELDDEKIQAVIRSMQKKRRESIDAYRDAGRDELAAAEAAEVEVLQAYLPPELTDEELGTLVDQAIADLPADAPRQPGPVTGKVMQKVAGRADGKRVAALVRQKLEG